MMKKTVLIFITLITVFNVTAQVNTHKLDFKIGSGIGFMGDGDLTALCLENELNYKLNSYLSTSISLGVARSLVNENRHNDYLQGSLNLFISPFRNNRLNNFKIGAGYTRVNEAISYWASSFYYNDTYIKKYEYSTSTINGFNVIVEDEYMISSRFLIGGKLFVTGGIEEGGVVSGGMIKLGILL